MKGTGFGLSPSCIARFKTRLKKHRMNEKLVSIADIRAAAARIASIAVKTPLVEASFPALSGHGTNKRTWLKAESLQPIGAFKIRGASNKILQLTPEEIRRGVITYSSGNHAQGVAYAAREVGGQGRHRDALECPRHQARCHLALGAEVVEVGVASSERLAKADELVRKHGYVVIPPLRRRADHRWPGHLRPGNCRGPAGRRSGARTRLRRRPDQRNRRGREAVAAPGQGLRRGAGAGRRRHGKLPHRQNRHLGSGADQPHHRRRPAHPNVGVRNFAHIQAFVDCIITVTEAEIRASMRAIVAATRLIPEPSGAVAAAALLFHGAELPAYTKAVAVVSGGNVAPELLAQVLTETAS